MRLRNALALGAFGLFACGNPEVIAPQPLIVLDTHPSNGAQVPPGQTPVLLVFSEPIDVATLPDAVILEETTAAGTPIREVPLVLDGWDAPAATATFSAEPLPAGATFQLSVRASALRAPSGAQLLADLVRRFSTAP